MSSEKPDPQLIDEVPVDIKNPQGEPTTAMPQVVPRTAANVAEIAGPPPEACITAQVKFVQQVVAAGGNAKPFGWEREAYRSFFRALPTVTKRQPETSNGIEGDDGCAIFDVGANLARKLTSIIHAVQQAQDNRTADDLACNVYAYEPVPPTYKLAQVTASSRPSSDFFLSRVYPPVPAPIGFRPAKVTRKRIHLINKAVGDQVATVRLGWNKAGDLGASINDNVGFSNYGMVPVTTFDEELDNVAGIVPFLDLN
eukprot:1179071-Prorocentrum_minimum.AAC.4